MSAPWFWLPNNSVLNPSTTKSEGVPLRQVYRIRIDNVDHLKSVFIKSGIASTTDLSSELFDSGVFDRVCVCS